jgi:hypothetical protein
MPEGLSAGEVGKEIGEHARHTSGGDHHARRASIIEAVLLSIVAIVAAYSGFSAAKWNTEASVSLAKASTARAKASRADLEALTKRNFDSSTFTVWFSAYVAGNKVAERIAERRFSPEFRPAFNAWIATHPATNPHAPPGPTYMKQYRQRGIALANAYDASADAHFAEGQHAGSTSDDYVRTTVFLASVLFLVGISGHFPLVAARYGLVAIGAVLLVISLVQLAELPRPP